MSIKEVVVDTSALVDSVDQRHPDRGEAFRYLQGAYPMQAPTLIVSETGNVIHGKHPEAFGEDPGERADVHELLLTGLTLTTSSQAVRARCGGLVQAHGLTFYGAEFLELASREEGRLLLTHDQRLATIGKDLLGEQRCLTLDEAGRAIAAGQL